MSTSKTKLYNMLYCFLILCFSCIILHVFANAIVEKELKGTVSTPTAADSVKFNDGGSFCYAEFTDCVAWYDDYLQLNDCPRVSFYDVFTEEDAVFYAELMWENMFEKDLLPYQPYWVYHDTDEHIWYVRGSFPHAEQSSVRPNTIVARGGGVPHAIIGEDGFVYAIWHDR